MYEQLAEPEPVSQAETNEEDGTEDTLVSVDYPETEIESAPGGELPIEDRRPIEDYRPYDQKNEVRESNVEAWRRLGASILP